MSDMPGIINISAVELPKMNMDPIDVRPIEKSFSNRHKKISQTIVRVISVLISTYVPYLEEIVSMSLFLAVIIFGDRLLSFACTKSYGDSLKVIRGGLLKEKEQKLH